MQLDCVYGAQAGPQCTPENPSGQRPQQTVSAWSGRFCDGPQTTVQLGAAYAHRIPDMINYGIQLDLRAFNEAQQRRQPVACQPGDVMNTP